MLIKMFMGRSGHVLFLIIKSGCCSKFYETCKWSMVDAECTYCMPNLVVCYFSQFVWIKMTVHVLKLILMTCFC